jgi:hypothetical protein
MCKSVDKFLSNDWEEFADKLEGLEERGSTMDHSKAILKEMGYSNAEIREICEWFRLNSAYCDTEVLLNIVYSEIVEMRR